MYALGVKYVTWIKIYRFLVNILVPTIHPTLKKTSQFICPKFYFYRCLLIDYSQFCTMSLFNGDILTVLPCHKKDIIYRHFYIRRENTQNIADPKKRRDPKLVCQRCTSIASISTPSWNSYTLKVSRFNNTTSFDSLSALEFNSVRRWWKDSQRKDMKVSLISLVMGSNPMF